MANTNAELAAVLYGEKKGFSMAQSISQALQTLSAMLVGCSRGLS
jgi:hypothetical protein